MGTNHVWIGGAGESLETLLTSLSDYYPVEASFAPDFSPGRSSIKEYSTSGMIRAEVHTPSYLEIELPPAYGAVVIDLAVDAGGADQSGLSAWAYLEVPGAGLRRYPLSFVAGQDGALRAAATIPAPGVPGVRVLVGVRGVDAAKGSIPPADTQTKVAWRAAYLPEELAMSLGILANELVESGALRPPAQVSRQSEATLPRRPA